MEGGLTNNIAELERLFFRLMLYIATSCLGAEKSPGRIVQLRIVRAKLSCAEVIRDLQPAASIRLLVFI